MSLGSTAVQYFCLWRLMDIQEFNSKKDSEILLRSGNGSANLIQIVDEELKTSNLILQREFDYGDSALGFISRKFQPIIFKAINNNVLSSKKIGLDTYVIISMNYDDAEEMLDTNYAFLGKIDGIEDFVKNTRNAYYTQMKK